MDLVKSIARLKGKSNIIWRTEIDGLETVQTWTARWQIRDLKRINDRLESSWLLQNGLPDSWIRLYLPRSQLKAKKAKVKRRGENSFLISVNVGQVNEKRNYTGLLAYAVKACGEDFISKIQSGEVT